MAYDATTQLEDDEKPQGSGAPGAGVESPLGGGQGGLIGAGGGGTGSGGGTQSPNTPSSSGSWTNLNSYLSANADQSQKIGNDLAGKINSQTDKATNSLKTASDAFRNQEPYKAVGAIGGSEDVNKYLDASQYANGGDTSKAQHLLNNDWGFNQQTTDLSKAPEWQTVTDDFNTASNTLQNTQSESGRKLLLQDQYGKNGLGYGQGLQNFDQLLTQQDPSNQVRLNALYQQLNPYYKNAQTQEQNSAKEFAEAAQAKAKDYQNQAWGSINSQLGGLSSNLGAETEQAKRAYDSQYGSYLDALSSNSLTRDQGAELGLLNNPDIYNLKQTDFAKFLNKSENPYEGAGGANYAASEGDFNAFHGLQNLLAGVTDGGTAQAQLQSLGLSGNPENYSHVQPPASFDLGGINSLASQANANYQDEFSKLRPGLLPGTAGAYSYKMLQDAINEAQNRPLGPTGKDKQMIADYQSRLDDFNKTQGYGNNFYGQGAQSGPFTGLGKAPIDNTPRGGKK